jgi:Sigma-70 region 2
VFADQGDERLSQIQTLWSVFQAAHGDQATAVSQAQALLLERYARAVTRYLRGAVRDAAVADELFQEFAVRFLRGDFHRANPERGRFRDFLKTALANLVNDYRRKVGRCRVQAGVAVPEPAVEGSPLADADQAFLTTWRDALLASAWDRLEQGDRDTGQHLFAVLRCHADHPEARSPQLADLLAAQLGKPISPEWVRKWLPRAREAFADLFVDEVAGSLAGAAPAALEEELAELGLLESCRLALQRRRAATAK